MAQGLLMPTGNGQMRVTVEWELEIQAMILRRTLQMHTRKLTLLQKMSRLRLRLRDPEWRRYGRLLLVGKLAGVALLIAGVALLPDLIGWKTFAADPDLKGNDVVNPLNTVWVL